MFKIANLFGHGDVKAYSLNEIKAFCNKAELKIDHLEASNNFRMHLVARKTGKQSSINITSSNLINGLESQMVNQRMRFHGEFQEQNKC